MAMRASAAERIDLARVEEILEQGGESIRANFDQLYSYYRPMMESHARRRGAVDPEGAADLGLFAGYQVADRLRDRSEPVFQAYLYRATANAAAKEARRNTPGVDLVEINEQNGPVKPSFEAALDDRDLLKTYIDQLPPDQSEVMAMTLKGMTAGEIASATGRERNAVYQLRHRGVLRLRDLLRVAGVVAVIIAAVFGFRFLQDLSAEQIVDEPVNEVERQTGDNGPNATVPDDGADTPASIAVVTEDEADTESPSATVPEGSGAASDPAGEFSSTSTTAVAQAAPPTEDVAGVDTVAVNDAVAVDVGETISLNVMANDSPSESVSRLVPGSGCLAGSDLSLLANGSIGGVASRAGTYTCNYTLTSTSGSSDTASLTVTVNDVSTELSRAVAPLRCAGDSSDIRIYFSPEASLPDTFQLLDANGALVVGFALGDASEVDRSTNEPNVHFSVGDNRFETVRSVRVSSNGMQPSDEIACSMS